MNVPADARQQWRGVCIVRPLAHYRGVAEAQNGIASRLVGRHPAADVVLRPHLDVGLQLGIDLAVYAGLAEEIHAAAKMTNDAANERHGRLPQAATMRSA